MKATSSKPMTIGVLAKSAEVGVETVRFYERRGLLKQPIKEGSGFRHYSDSDIRKIRFIKRAQELGFTLEETRELLEMEVCSKATRPALQKKSQKKIDEIQQKIADLNEMLAALKKFSKSCGTKNTSTQECGILDCFEKRWECCQTGKCTCSKENCNCCCGTEACQCGESCACDCRSDS